jgi:polar amino acid transport system substrate-binding protein
MKNTIVFVSLYVLLNIFCLLSFAAENTIHLVTGNNYPPFTDESLPQRGMVTEIVEAAFQEMGYQAIITFRPWKRGYEETKKGVFAGTFPYIKTEERQQEFYYSQPINTVYTRIFVTKASSIKRIEDLPGQRICIPLGYGVSKEFDELLRQNAFKHEVNPVDLEGCLRMMLSGRKDFFIINEINGWMTIQNTFQTKEHFRALDTIFEEETHHLIVPKTHPDGEKMLELFNRGLERMRHKGALQEIINKHLKEILD